MSLICTEHNFCRSKYAISLCENCHKALDVLDKEHEFWVGANCSLVKQNDKLRATLKKYQWISVEDRLPEMKQWVLIWGSLDHEVAWREEINSKISWVDSNNFACDVTHWMPLPPPPKDEE